MPQERIKKLDWYFEIVKAIGLRSTCDRGRNAAIIVKDGRILATGYAGAPANAPHCDDIDHEMEIRLPYTGPINGLGTLMKSEHCIRTVHAEINAILQAAKYGPPVQGAKMYCTSFPCYACAQAIVNAGIIDVVALNDYHASQRSKELFNQVGIECGIKNLKTED